jgi:hypothetical protein
MMDGQEDPPPPLPPSTSSRSLPASPLRPPAFPSRSAAALAGMPHLRLGEGATGSLSSIGVSGYSSDDCGLRSSRGGRFNRGRTQPFFIGVAGVNWGEIDCCMGRLPGLTGPRFQWAGVVRTGRARALHTAWDSRKTERERVGERKHPLRPQTLPLSSFIHRRHRLRQDHGVRGDLPAPARPVRGHAVPGLVLQGADAEGAGQRER